MEVQADKLASMAALVISCVAVASVAYAGGTLVIPGIHNGVITACIEPPTKGNKATSGDINMSRINCAREAPGRSPGTSGGQQARRVRRAAQAQQAQQAQQVRQASRTARSAGPPGQSATRRSTPW